MKRVFDVLISFLMLCIFCPIILMAALLIKIRLGSPILFKQKRIGYKEKIFTVYKFRTMTNEKDENGNYLTDSIRLTNFGMFIRKLSIDEMPQLLNVLKGDMSLVGPRPLLTRYLPYYSNEEKKRHTVRPGITGLAQVNGRNHLDWDSRLALDVKYVENMCFWLDIKIISKTVRKVLIRDGVANIPNEQMLDFDVERRLRA